VDPELDEHVWTWVRTVLGDRWPASAMRRLA
jgi:hypothetical protein